MSRIISRNCWPLPREVALVFIRHLLAAGADCIIMFNPSASPAVLPTKIFKEFELPNLKKIFSFIKEFNHEAITWYSVAGAVQDIIKDLEDANIDIMTIDYLVPLDVAFGISSSLCFNGNIKSISFVNEKPEEIFPNQRRFCKPRWNVEGLSRVPDVRCHRTPGWILFRRLSMHPSTSQGILRCTGMG